MCECHKQYTVINRHILRLYNIYLFVYKSFIKVWETELLTVIIPCKHKDCIHVDGSLKEQCLYIFHCGFSLLLGKTLFSNVYVRQRHDSCFIYYYLSRSFLKKNLCFVSTPTPDRQKFERIQRPGRFNRVV